MQWKPLIFFYSHVSLRDAWGIRKSEQSTLLFSQTAAAPLFDTPCWTRGNCLAGPNSGKCIFPVTEFSAAVCWLSIKSSLIYFWNLFLSYHWRQDGPNEVLNRNGIWSIDSKPTKNLQLHFYISVGLMPNGPPPTLRIPVLGVSLVHSVLMQRQVTLTAVFVSAGILTPLCVRGCHRSVWCGKWNPCVNSELMTMKKGPFPTTFLASSYD